MNEEAPAEVLPGIWHLPVVVERNVPPTVNVYAIESGGRLLLVDVGWDETSGRSLEAGLRGIGAGLDDIEGVVLTHGHPDHAGLASWVQERTGCWVGVHPADRRRFGPPPDAPGMARLGAPPGVDEALARKFGSVEVGVPRLTLLDDGAEVPVRGGRSLKTVWTPGHSPGHLCLLDSSGALFTGDHVLPGIRPRLNEAGTGADPVGAYFESLRRTRGLRAALILPGHGSPTADAAALHDDVRRHYEARGRRILAAVPRGPGGMTAWDVAGVLAADRETAPSLTAQALAATEVVNFLHHLRRTGEVRSEGDPARWSRATSPSPTDQPVAGAAAPGKP
ncbi:glyoxylase-like metal-dependent hydrolase (beta-lactamase superfamily II) [Actinocorallia herbida]|uniref:Glyoxylase-like metal-dependent hydrolase (Beta-lactamase superfamily II) n=1 Tax=Actinocorallia herbida TaxID=58109 RepID=A0A3N1CXI9_9ACTN|nr:MBL fold metallo-hydrolase [Actinocorallia herbida]ROO86007.1 glyoxylase-like metal-dependent hydrolase (beta-lactamase superfamily II) [Actinocorallia herbida]